MGIAPEHPEYVALRDAFLAQYEAALCVDTTLFADVDALLDAIEARSLKWGIVTNKATRYTTPLLERSASASAPAPSSAATRRRYPKPHPAPLLAAARQLGVAPARCVYVGDAERDVTAGIAAGMRTIVARYGYIEAHENAGDLAGRRRHRPSGGAARLAAARVARRGSAAADQPGTGPGVDEQPRRRLAVARCRRRAPAGSRPAA